MYAALESKAVSRRIAFESLSEKTQNWKNRNEHDFHTCASYSLTPRPGRVAVTFKVRRNGFFSAVSPALGSE